jgi:hypothetical protein
MFIPLAEPEPVERRLFARAGAEVFFGPAPAAEPGILIKCYPKFFIIKFEFDYKNYNFVAIYFKEL